MDLWTREETISILVNKRTRCLDDEIQGCVWISCGLSCQLRIKSSPTYTCPRIEMQVSILFYKT